MNTVEDIDAVIRLWVDDLAQAVSDGDSARAEEVEDNLAALRRYRIQFIQSNPGYTQMEGS